MIKDRPLWGHYPKRNNQLNLNSILASLDRDDMELKSVSQTRPKTTNSTNADCCSFKISWRFCLNKSRYRKYDILYKDRVVLDLLNRMVINSAWCLKVIPNASFTVSLGTLKFWVVIKPKP